MPRFAANLDFLFRELPLLERIDAAAEAGFDGIEILFPYDDPAGDILDRVRRNGLGFALMNAPPPNYTGGARGFAAVPALKDRFRSDFRRALRYAGRLEAQRIHIMAGNCSGLAARATLVENLAWAAAEAPGIGLTIEPLNPGDMPGYFLNDFDLAAEIIAEVAAPNLGLQFDVYHAHRIAGDAQAIWNRHRALVTHIQICGLPIRNEPLGGLFDFGAFFRALDAGGYAGYVSAEYNPAGQTLAGLSWMKDF